ncbi:MAG: aminoacyl-tRNA hydrolase [Gammaproteobacteria bacterium]|nr:aminoacyl-tRNA hydrolase [Gammaproteobacteria bacterium]
MAPPSTLPVRLIVGLGNPGSEYQHTRHNAGSWFVELLAERNGGIFKPESKFQGETCRIFADGRECWLLKPTTFMNCSGRSVSSLAGYFRIPPEQILVAHDELDLPVGSVRLKQGGGHAGHNGLRDIISALGGKDFWRLRIGINHPGDSHRVVNYVLGRPSRDESVAIDDAVSLSEGALPDILSGKFQKAMHRLHSVN